MHVTHINQDANIIFSVDRMTYEYIQLSDFSVYIIIALSSEILQGFVIHDISIVDEFHGRSTIKFHWKYPVMINIYLKD